LNGAVGVGIAGNACISGYFFLNESPSSSGKDSYLKASLISSQSRSDLNDMVSYLYFHKNLP